MVQLIIYLCMNLPQAVSFPPQLRIDWDLSRRIPLVAEGELEPAVVGCSVAAPLLFHAAPLHSAPTKGPSMMPSFVAVSQQLSVGISDSSTD